jgi:hypothetical protein
VRTATFIGTKENGKPKIFDLAGFNAVLAEYCDGEDFYIHIEEPGRQRTRAQNRFFHGAILKAFAETFNGTAEAKTELCLRFLPQEHVRPDGSIVIVPGHTSSLNVEDFNAFIESCIQLAAENDIYIKDGAEWRAQQAKEAREAAQKARKAS